MRRSVLWRARLVLTNQLLQMDQSIAHGLLAGGVSLRLLPAVLPPDLSGAQAAPPISFCMATPAALLLVGYAVLDKVYLCPKSHMLNWRVRLMQGYSTLVHLWALFDTFFQRSSTRSRCGE